MGKAIKNKPLINFVEPDSHYLCQEFVHVATNLRSLGDDMSLRRDSSFSKCRRHNDQRCIYTPERISGKDVVFLKSRGCKVLATEKASAVFDLSCTCRFSYGQKPLHICTKRERGRDSQQEKANDIVVLRYFLFIFMLHPVIKNFTAFALYIVII